MTDLNVAAPLAAALASKGYDALTPVQHAVLEASLAGRDLLVSAQTGSGKTVAFGLAIAPELLSADMAVAAAPRALVVAPTRELALQVRREFEWLYAQTGAQVASCVGGMDWRTERRALERAPAIVVGTPGRLRDHIEKGSLNLSELRAVVLDEADEMLDLGFQEDLEFILSAAPDTRRTLMFSATVPKAIEALARSYQRDAARVQVQGEARQHVDISYQAMNVAARDRENAVINLLLLQAARVAIVFCKTRAAVTHLHTRMANRGFKVVALSGELSQAERTQALQSLRDGRAQVCIATDVAARGIDLPGLDLVVHFDLPSNPETLLHRSGRTGRAGSKGTAVLVVPPSEYRKAQRILQGAKVEAVWTNPPTADEVQAAEDARMLAAEPLLEAITDDEAALVDAILGVAGPEGAAAGFLRLWRAGRSAPEIVGELPPVTPTAPRPARDKAEFGPSVWFSLSVGHEGRAEARWLLPKICDAGGITRTDIGAIRVQQRETFVQIAETAASRFKSGTEIDDGLVLTRMDTAPDLDRPQTPRAPFKAGDRDTGRKPYVKREDSERKPYTPRPLIAEDGARKPYTPRAATSDAKPHARREDQERKPYAPRSDSSQRKPSAPRNDAGARKPDAPKPYAPRAAGSAAKPYAKREDGARKPHAPRGTGTDAKPWAKRDDAPRKPRAAKSFAGAEARPTRAAAPKPNLADPGVSLRKPRGPASKGAPKGFKPKR